MDANQCSRRADEAGFEIYCHKEAQKAQKDFEQKDAKV